MDDELNELNIMFLTLLEKKVLLSFQDSEVANISRTWVLHYFKRVVFSITVINLIDPVRYAHQ